MMISWKTQFLKTDTFISLVTIYKLQNISENDQAWVFSKIVSTQFEDYLKQNDQKCLHFPFILFEPAD